MAATRVKLVLRAGVPAQFLPQTHSGTISVTSQEIGGSGARAPEMTSAARASSTWVGGGVQELLRVVAIACSGGHPPALDRAGRACLIAARIGADELDRHDLKPHAAKRTDSEARPLAARGRG